MFSLISNSLPLALRNSRGLIAAGLGIAAAAGIASYMLTRRRPTAEEIERERRELLARTGRITDGTIMDTLMTEIRDAKAVEAKVRDPIADPDPIDPPHIIVYNYRIAGVTYECAQDVTMLAEYVHGVRTDLPIQVRYQPHNPGNSIIVAETWNGLRLVSAPPHRSQPSTTHTA